MPERLHFAFGQIAVSVFFRVEADAAPEYPILIRPENQNVRLICDGIYKLSLYLSSKKSRLPEIICQSESLIVNLGCVSVFSL